MPVAAPDAPLASPSPLLAGPNAWRVYEMASGRRADEEDPRFGGSLTGAPPVPTTAIFSRTDGIAPGRAAARKRPRCPKARGRKQPLRLGHHPAVVYAVADRLAQAEGEWSPFDRSGGAVGLSGSAPLNALLLPFAWRRTLPGREAHPVISKDAAGWPDSAAVLATRWSTGEAARSANRDCPSSQAPILTRGSLKRILRVTALRQWTARVIALQSSGALEIGCAGRDGSNPFVDGAARTSAWFSVRKRRHS